MSSTTPPLTGILRCLANRFPEPSAVELLSGAGFRYVALHNGWRAFSADMRALPPLVDRGGTTIFELPPTTPTLYDAAILRGRTLPLFMPRRAPAGAPVNAAIDLRPVVGAARATVHPAVRVDVRLSRGDVDLGTRRSVLRLPAVLDARTVEAPFTFEAPASDGPLHVRVVLDGGVVAEGDVEVGPLVPGAAATPADLAGVELGVDASAAPWLYGRCGELRVTVRNGSRALLQAYPVRLVLPPEAGKVVLDVDFLRAGRSVKNLRAYQWWRHPALLWHDLAPGDESTVTAFLEAPNEQGPFTLSARLGVIGRGQVAAASTELAVGRLTP